MIIINIIITEFKIQLFECLFLLILIVNPMQTFDVIIDYLY